MFRKYIKIRFFGHSPERFLNLCRQKQIAIWDLESNSDTYSCCMHAKDFKKMKALARKTKVKLKIIEKHGLSFFLFRYRKRRLFFLGMLLAFCVVIFLSRFIWDIEIRGNQRISDDVIYDYLKDKKVYHYGYHNSQPLYGFPFLSPHLILLKVFGIARKNCGQ